MRRAGNRILGDSFGRSEEARDEVDFQAGRRRDHCKTIEIHERLHVRLQRAEFVLRSVHDEIIPRR